MAKAQPMKVLNDFFDDYMRRLVEDPELGDGKRAADPEQSILDKIGIIYWSFLLNKIF